MHIIKLNLVAILLCGFGSTLELTNASAAPACDPDKILRQNVDQYKANLAVWLSYVNNLTRSTQESSSDSFGITYAGIGLNFSDARALAEYISQQTNYTLSQQQSVSILRSTLSAESVKAYIACVKSSQRSVAIEIPDAALNEPAFQIAVEWAPDYTPRGKTLVLSATNGKIEGKDKYSIPVSVPFNKTFNVSRDVSKTFFLSAQVDTQSDLVSLPSKPAFVMKIREKFAPPADKPEFYYIEDGGHSLDPVAADWCISASDGSVLLPSTMIAQVTVSGDPRRARTTVNEDKKNNVHKACGRVYDSTGCKECSQQIRGRFSIWEAYLADAPTAGGVLKAEEFGRKRSLMDIAAPPTQ